MKRSTAITAVMTLAASAVVALSRRAGHGSARCADRRPRWTGSRVVGRRSGRQQQPCLLHQLRRHVDPDQGAPGNQRPAVRLRMNARTVACRSSVATRS